MNEQETQQRLHDDKEFRDQSNKRFWNQMGIIAERNNTQIRFNLRPHKDICLLVKCEKDMKRGSILLPETSVMDLNSQPYLVWAIGDKVKDVQVGDKVIYRHPSGMSFKDTDDVVVNLVPVEDILAIL